MILEWFPINLKDVIMAFNVFLRTSFSKICPMYFNKAHLRKCYTEIQRPSKIGATLSSWSVRFSNHRTFSVTIGSFQGDLYIAAALHHLRVVTKLPEPQIHSNLIPTDTQYADDIEFLMKKKSISKKNYFQQLKIFSKNGS